MNWLNINVSTLRSPEFIGSEPVARATWLCVLGYCFDQENAGIVPNSRLWKDRQWQQTCGVTAQEVSDSYPLLFWDGDDLHVWNYPVDKQHEVQGKRRSGKRGGMSKSEAKTEAARINGAKHNPTGTQAETEAEPKHNPSTTQAETQRNRNRNRNRKGIEEEYLAPADAAAEERPKDLIFEALCAATGTDIASLTKSGRGAINGALKDIRSASPEVTPEEIKSRAAAYARKFPSAALTAPALAKHWASCGSTAEAESMDDFVERMNRPIPAGFTR